MSVHPAVTFLGGLIALIVGAEVLLRGASRLAAMLGLKPIIIGLTVVAVGASAPELAVCITAVTEGRGPFLDLAPQPVSSQLAHTNDSLVLEIRSTLDQPANDEAFGADNVRVMIR